MFDSGGCSGIVDFSGASIPRFSDSRPIIQYPVEPVFTTAILQFANTTWSRDKSFAMDLTSSFSLKNICSRSRCSFCGAALRENNVVELPAILRLARSSKSRNRPMMKMNGHGEDSGCDGTIRLLASTPVCVGLNFYFSTIRRSVCPSPGPCPDLG